MKIKTYVMMLGVIAFSTSMYATIWDDIKSTAKSAVQTVKETSDKVEQKQEQLFKEGAARMGVVDYSNVPKIPEQEPVVVKEVSGPTTKTGVPTH